MPLMKPATSDRNFTPSTTGRVSPPSTMAGVGLLGQIVVVEELTVMLSPVLPLTAPSVAEIVVLPAATAVASPVESIVAAAVFEDAHVTWLVRFCVLESEYVPVAVYGCVAPTVSVPLAGVTAIDVSVAAGCALKSTSTQ